MNFDINFFFVRCNDEGVAFLNSLPSVEIDLRRFVDARCNIVCVVVVSGTSIILKSNVVSGLGVVPSFRVRKTEYCFNS